MAETGARRSPVLTGGCQCGAVRYALYAAPGGTTICHCRMCQKASGGPFEALAPVAGGDFAWTRGPAGTFRSSSIVERDFCAACGTPLTYRNLGRDRVSVTVGSLDEPARAAPVGQYGLESRLPWCRPGLLDLPGVETEASYAGLTSYQHPDHETPRWPPQAEETPPR
ncbi:MAG: GFA family protein [Acidisphaera sp.]|nr:GFA family protein [Acidisphaera sp.]